MDFLAYKFDPIIEDEASYSEEEEEYEESDEYTEENYSDMHQQGRSAGYICDTCEREFQTYWQHQKHMSEHRTCGIDGCTFTAHEKIIEKHIRMQHSSGLYDKIRNLSTPEDISKWIEERKKKYPKKENVEKRYKQQEEMLQRGEKLQRNSSRFDKNNKTRFSLNRQNRTQQQRTFKKKTPSKRKLAQQQQQNKPISLIDDKSDWNGNLFPFKGTSQLYNEKPVENLNDFDDAEWSEEATSSAPEKIVLKNALGALMCAYNSGDDSEIEDLIPKNEVELHIQTLGEKIKEDEPKAALIVETPNETISQPPLEVTVTNNTPSDDEAPTEQKIERLDVLPESNCTQTHNSNNNNKHTRKRKRVHKKGSNKQQKYGNNYNTNDKSHNIYKKRRITLLERLLTSEITHERNVLLQCVRYVVANGFFDNKISDDKPEVIKAEENGDYEIENSCIPDDKIIDATVV